jgi:inner membrane protein
LILIAYVGFTHSLGRQAERIALSTETDFNTAQANPVPGNPFQHRMILVHDDYYQVITPSGETYRVARQTPDKVVTRAMQDPAIQGFINWMRFPYWQVTAQPDGWLVTFKDLRYVAPDQQTPTGIGLAQSKVRFE